MKQLNQYSKLYQADLYDQIKTINENHIICLDSCQTRTFLLLSIIRNRAHQLHSKYGANVTLIIEPDEQHAKERQRILSDHTELQIINFFRQKLKSQNDEHAQIRGVVICSIQDVVTYDQIFKNQKFNLVILDFAHLLLLQNLELVKYIVNRFKGVQMLAFMRSLIYDNHDLTPINTVQLISRLETIFSAKCETSSDLKSLSKQSMVTTNLEIVEVNSNELIACDWFLLADSMLKQFCDFILETNLENDEPVIKPDADLVFEPAAQPVMTLKKQLVLVRSCLVDLIYSMHCLGLWCTKKTIQLYLTEFSRLLQDDPSIALVASACSILNCFYARLDEMTTHYSVKEGKDIIILGSTRQLISVLESIKETRETSAGPQDKSKETSNAAQDRSKLICVIHVQRRVIAKVIALWLDRVAKNHDEYSFIRPNYIVASSRKHRNKLAVDNFDLHHEASIRDFRFGICNTLVTAAMNERCTDIPRCHLVISFDLPNRFSDFIQVKGNCRNDSSKYIIMLNNFLEINASDRLLNYINMERLLNNVNKKISSESEEIALLEKLEAIYKPYPSKNSKNPATLWRSINIIGKYCTKLPSDSFTKLSPEWFIREVENSQNEQQFVCEMRLPINSPVRQTIIGAHAPTKNISMRLAAYTACKELHKYGELDDNMSPITKEFMKSPKPPTQPNQDPSTKGQSIGTTKHRQYYQKRTAEVFSGPLVLEGITCYLYKFKMVLTCPIPDEQNRRGRRIIDPSETNRNHAIVCTTKLPKICSFPVYTRSGEVMVSVELIGQGFRLDPAQVEELRIFHKFTFSKVLKLEKYPTSFDPDKSPNTVLLAPVVDLTDGSMIDWAFIHKIVQSNQKPFRPTDEERKAFKFNHEDYVDAVVIPWYRNSCNGSCGQQFAYYVAEICTDLTPRGAFPDKSSGFETFIDYYKTKYNLTIYNTEQPVLDVDHTSARLNLLTPRYVNRKGRTLPSSTAKTRQESRESLVQKQLLVPELCSIHPFPASFWRKAVCLPGIFYRLNSLFLAEEFRRQVAQDTQIGFVEPPDDFEWPPLDFGWSLKDVINNQQLEDDNQLETCQKNVEETKKKSRKKKENKEEKQLKEPLVPPKPIQVNVNETVQSDDYVIDHFDPSKYEIPDIPLDALAPDWTNIKLISSGTVSSSDGPTGWDQPLEQQDILLEHSSDLTWYDCEMEYEGGEITEKVPQIVRCGSPSSFEPTVKEINEQTEINSTANGGTCVAPTKTPNCEFKPTDTLPDSLKDKFDSRSSTPWSDSEDEDEFDTGNSDDESRLYGKWSDSKSKKRPLPREIFIPSTTTFKASSTSEIGTLHKIMKCIPTSLNDESNEIYSNTMQNLPTKSLYSENCQMLISKASELTNKKVHLTDTDITSEITKWKTLLHGMYEKLDSSLQKEPDMFSDSEPDFVSVESTIPEYRMETQPTFGELLPNRDVEREWKNEKWKTIKFDPLREEITSIGPGPSVILQALTMSNASDGINLERLETVGDSFLKYSITAYLYCTHPTLHEGKLSKQRSLQISNANLYQLGKKKKLAEIISATKFEPNDNWLPPGYSVGNKSAEVEEEVSNKKKEIDKALKEVPYDLLLQHSIPDKSIADCVEALIGAYLTASGSRAAILFMKWLGLEVVPPTFNLEEDLKRTDCPKEMWRWLETPESPLVYLPPTCQDSMESSIPNNNRQQFKESALEELNRIYCASDFEKFEKDIQYTFKDKAYLVQAFTHNSFNENRVTGCHQRLEFLGDALLDYLITRYLFEDPRCHSPGTLTDLRSALVNNTFFASLAVKYMFHKYLRYTSDDLFHSIDGFVEKFGCDRNDTITKNFTLLLTEGESEYAEDIEVPKALGDVFESVAGAIYLDSGMSLDQVWEVYFRMMKPEIEYFSTDVPKSPIRELLESMPQNVRFGNPEIAPDKKSRVIAEVFGIGRFTGVGKNKHSAKSTAAKRALRKIYQTKKEQNQ